MSDEIGFRQDLVNQYVSKIEGYIAVQQQTRSAATVEGAEFNLRIWADERSTPALTKSEHKAVRLALLNIVGSEQRQRGGEKRVDHVEVVREERPNLFFHVTYSDRLVIETSAKRIALGALTRSAGWDRGDGWPLVPFEAAVHAKDRWYAARSEPSSPTG